MSSLSMRKVSGRANNAVTQNHNNYSLWMKPLSHAEYPVTNVNGATPNGVVTSNGSRELIFAQPNFTFDGSKVDISGTLHSSGNIDTSANITSVGTMIPSSYRSGQVINILFLQSTLIGEVNPSTQFGQFSGTITPADNTLETDYQVAEYNYTPLHASSRIIVDYGCLYEVGGNSSSANDEFDSRIIINGVTVARRYQRWLYSGGAGVGTGTRGSTLFPITGGASNASLGAPGAKNIKIVIRRFSGDDTITFANASFDAYMRITEIGA
jgi:hypothetical protein